MLNRIWNHSRGDNNSNDLLKLKELYPLIEWNTVDTWYEGLFSYSNPEGVVKYCEINIFRENDKKELYSGYIHIGKNSPITEGWCIPLGDYDSLDALLERFKQISLYNNGDTPTPLKR